MDRSFSNEIGKQIFIQGLNELNAGLNSRRKLSEQDWEAYNRRLNNGTIVHEVDCGCFKCQRDNDWRLSEDQLKEKIFNKEETR